MAVAVAAAAEAGAVGAIPRDYNFAADVLQKNLDAGRAGKPAYIDAARHAHLRPARRPRGALRRRAAGPRRQARRARADRAARHHRLADGVSRLPEGRHHCRAGQHAADRGRLPLHARRQPGQVPGRVGGAVSALREADQAKPRSRARHRLGRQSARLSSVRGCHWRRRARALHRADHAATTSHSGSTPRARPESRRAPCMCMRA